MWPRIVAGIFIPVGNHYFQALASTLQFVAQVCDRLWLVPATDRAFACITYMSPPHVALVCSGPPQKRGHLWLNNVASVLGPYRIRGSTRPRALVRHEGRTTDGEGRGHARGARRVGGRTGVVTRVVFVSAFDHQHGGELVSFRYS